MGRTTKIKVNKSITSRCIFSCTILIGFCSFLLFQSVFYFIVILNWKASLHQNEQELVDFESIEREMRGSIITSELIIYIDKLIYDSESREENNNDFIEKKEATLVVTKETIKEFLEDRDRIIDNLREIRYVIRHATKVVAVYSMLGIFMMVFTAAYVMYYLQKEINVKMFNDNNSLEYLDFVLFSFVVVTSLGHSKLYPITRGTKLLVIALHILGLIYMVFLVTGIIGLLTS